MQQMPSDRGVEGLKPSATTLYVTFVSSFIPEGEKYMRIAELSLTSFLMSFQQPVKGVQLELSVYMQCTEEKLRKVQQLHETYVDKPLEGYVNATVESISTFAGAFSKISYFCSSLLGQAVCHTGRTIRNTTTNKYGYFFFLEHDWILLPSKMQPHLSSIFKTLDGPIAYITMQRGGRTQYEKLPGKLNLRRYGYTNNPFFSSLSFLKFITSSKADLCSKASFRDWEYMTSKFCSTHQCKTSLMGTAGSRPNVYHVDGRFLSFAAKSSIGPLFQNLRPSMLNYLARKVSAQRIVEDLDQICTRHRFLCGPMYIRKEFMLQLLEYRARNNMRNVGMIPSISLFLNDSSLAKLVARGELPGRVCFQQLFS